MEVLEKISHFFYAWFLNADPDTAPEFKDVYQVGTGTNEGMAWAFLFLVGVSLLVTLFFYFVYCQNADKSSVSSYLWICLIGYVALVVVNIVGLKLITKGDVFTWNMLRLCLLDIVYYLICFGIFSEIFRELSRYASNISLTRIFFAKKK